MGAGERVTATLQSGVEPVLPDPPTRLAVSNIQAFSVLLQFTPGFDGNASVSKWTVQVCAVKRILLLKFSYTVTLFLFILVSHAKNLYCRHLIVKHSLQVDLIKVNSIKFK